MADLERFWGTTF